MKKFRIVKKRNVYIVEIETKVVKVRKFWFNKITVVFKPLNELGTPLARNNMTRRTKRKVGTLKIFATKWQAEIWLNKIKKRVENRI